MIYIREFEFYVDDAGFVVADPCDMQGGTFGTSLEDAAESASEWLSDTVIDNLAHGRKTEGGKLGHKPRHSGQVIALSVNTDLTRADAVTAADAARMLGVSTARVAQMCKTGKLTSWKEGSKRLIMRRSIEARLEEQPKPGRPKAARG